ASAFSVSDRIRSSASQRAPPCGCLVTSLFTLHTLFGHCLYHFLTLGHERAPNGPERRAGKGGRDLGERDFFETQPRLPCLAECASMLGHEGIKHGNQEHPSRRVRSHLESELPA